MYILKHIETDEFICQCSPGFLIHSDRLSEAMLFTCEEAHEFVKTFPEESKNHRVSTLRSEIEEIESQLHLTI